MKRSNSISLVADYKKVIEIIQIPETKKDLWKLFLLKEISEQQLNFHHERDLFNEELSMNNKILALKATNPDVIVKGKFFF